MRFCLVSTQENWGGGETLIWDLAEELRHEGHQVGWIARRASEVVARLESRNAVVLHRCQGRGFRWGDWLSTLRAFRAWAPDVVVYNDSHAVPLVGVANLFAQQPRAVGLAYKHTVFPLRGKLKYRLLTDKVVCVSKAAYRTVVEGGLSSEHAVIVPGGIPVMWADSEEVNGLRSSLGVSESDSMLVSVGSLLECKGHVELIEAVSMLARKGESVRLFIAGEGEQRPILEAKIAELGVQSHVHLLGYRSDVTALLLAADLVVHPSHAEGLSLVLIQAQMLCKPIVATAVGGTVEVLGSENPAQCSAWLAEPRSAVSLATQICQALLALHEESEILPSKLHRTAERTRRDYDIANNARRLVEVAAALVELR